MHHYSLRMWNERKLPTLTASQMAVFRAIEALGRANTQEVADHMRVQLNTISGRFKEMKAKGWIEEVPGEGRTVWRVVMKEPKTVAMF